LFRPPKNATTYLLWYGPGALMVIALTLLGWILWRRRSQVTTAPLSREEQERLRRLLDDDNKGSA
jgi:cytochrome c-type biogenesis protein CcmH